MTVLLSNNRICKYISIKKGPRHHTADPGGNHDYKLYSSRFKHLRDGLLIFCTNRPYGGFKTNRRIGRFRRQPSSLKRPFIAGYIFRNVLYRSSYSAVNSGSG